MARRRMNRSSMGTTPPAAPIPEAQPDAPPPFETQAPVATAPPPAAVAPAESTAVALPQNLSPALANIFSTPFAPPANLDLSEDSGKSQVRFYTGKGETVTAVNADVPNITKGTPYLFCPVEDGKSYHMMGDLRYVALRTYAYYASHDSQYKVLKSWERNPGGREVMVNGALMRVAECIMSLGIILPSDKAALPGGLEPAVATLDVFRGAQCRGPKKLIAAQVATTKPGWAREGNNGGAITAPVQLRVCASVAGNFGTTKPNAKGETFGYTVCSMFPATVADAQVQALGEWSTDAELQVELADYSAEFDRRVADIESKR